LRLGRANQNSNDLPISSNVQGVVGDANSGRTGIGETLLSGLAMSFQNGNFFNGGVGGDFFSEQKNNEAPKQEQLSNSFKGDQNPPLPTEKSFLRGQVKLETMTEWQREEQIKRLKAQQELQV
jgi:hypothetical protein